MPARRACGAKQPFRPCTKLRHVHEFSCTHLPAPVAAGAPVGVQMHMCAACPHAIFGPGLAACLLYEPVLT